MKTKLKKFTGIRLPKNRRAQAEEAIGFFWEFFLLAIIGVGIALGVAIFLGQDYDTRQSDAEALTYIIKECIKNNRLETRAPLSAEQLYSNCNLNKQAVEKNFVIEIKKDAQQIYTFGTTQACVLNQKNKEFPRCSSSTFQTEKGKFTILTGSKQNAVETNYIRSSAQKTEVLQP